MREELVIDRPSQDKTLAAVAASTTVKSILFPVHLGEGLEQRLQVALSIARSLEAHLHLLHVTPLQAYNVIDAYGAFVSGEIVEALQKEAEEMRARLEVQLAKEDVSWDYEEVTGELMPHLLYCAALSDLVVVGRERPAPEFSGPAISFFGDLLHRLRTPLLIIGDNSGPFDAFGKAVVAWNGSYEAANALRASLGLLKCASEVRVLTVEEEKPGTFPSTRAVEYLSRHGIHAELTVRPHTSVTFAEHLITYAMANDAAYVVMGGYGHSRAGEYFFGGTTRDLLADCPFPLVMAR